MLEKKYLRDLAVGLDETIARDYLLSGEAHLILNIRLSRGRLLYLAPLS
ncbi:MAG: hypothetical protein F6K16_28115 [Symploca sp. SIO2B6]|nr:hypothetical protein [Symploca sp. SIO2B6]